MAVQTTVERTPGRSLFPGFHILNHGSSILRLRQIQGLNLKLRKSRTTSGGTADQKRGPLARLRNRPLKNVSIQICLGHSGSLSATPVRPRRGRLQRKVKCHRQSADASHAIFGFTPRLIRRKSRGCLIVQNGRESPQKNGPQALPWADLMTPKASCSGSSNPQTDIGIFRPALPATRAPGRRPRLQPSDWILSGARQESAMPPNPEDDARRAPPRAPRRRAPRCGCAPLHRSA
jgi:hypothetical protein